MNIKGFLVIIFVLYFPLMLNAQYELKISRKSFKTDIEEGFKEAWWNILDGNKYFEAGPGTYNLAREHYLQAHQYNSEHPVLNFKLGVCYLYTDDKYEAIKYMRKAYDQAPSLSIEMHYLLARAYHLVLEFDKAIEHYREYIKVLKPEEFAIQHEFIEKLIQECENGKKIVENPIRVIIKNMGPEINSFYDDYFSVFTTTDSLLFFNSRRPFGKNKKRNPYDNKFYENIFMSQMVDGSWTTASLVSELSRKAKNDAVIGASADGNELYVYRGKKNRGDIYVSEKKNGEWKSPKPFSSKINSRDFEGSVFVTPGNDSIFFISSNEELTHGGKDIFFSSKDKKGKWRDPANLGSILNTKYDESGVFLTSDRNEIYFSSKGHNTMGGYDIFRSVKRSDGTWSDPVNLGYPVNTPDDDIFFSLSPDGKYGYYSTIREGGMGARDIYQVVFLGSEKEFILSTEDINVAGVLDLTKKGFFSSLQILEVDSSYSLTGKVFDKKTNEPVIAKLEFFDVEASAIVATTMSDENGSYRVKFSMAKNYGVEIKAKDYLFFLDAINITGASTDEPVIIDFLLEKVEIGTKVILENIYFETNKATLTSASFTQLNQVIEFMESNPSLRMEISGHTDNVGSLKLNTKLSEDRAKSVVDYLVANGIDRARLESRGFAFSQPIAPNDTPDGREKNRRVEFKVTGI